MTTQRMGQLVPKSIAVKLGLKRYFDGSSCKKGHIDERYVKDGVCVECAREKLRARYQKDPEKQKLWSRTHRMSMNDEKRAELAARTRHARKVDPDRYKVYDAAKQRRIKLDAERLEKERARQRNKQARAYRKDPEKYKSRTKAYRQDPTIRQRMNEQARQYKKQNPGVVAELNRKHAPLRRAALIKRSPPWLTDEHKHQMYLIYKDAHSRGLHVDHIVPLRGKLVSGLHVPWNLQPLEPVQNSRKRNHFEVTL